LRGELTRSATMPSQPSILQNLESIQGLLSRFVDLSSRGQASITVIPPGAEDTEQAAAPWTWTAGEVASTEASLLPSLFHLAVAKGDVESLRSCLASSSDDNDIQGASHPIAGGLANCIEPGGGRSPLHVASMNGNVAVLEFLLQSGALVHLRDLLGHTALYYVSITRPHRSRGTMHRTYLLHT
jgi:lysophospholipase